MAKKTFRATKRSNSDYPRLVDVDAGMLAKLGLVAIGGLALGGAGCKENAAIAGARPTTAAIDGGSAHRAPPKAQDKKEPVEPVALPPPGAPPPARIDPTPEPQPPKTKPHVKSDEKPTKPRPPMMGKVRPPRLDPTD